MSGARRVAPAALLLAGFVALWQGVATLDSVDDLTLASPAETLTALGDDWSLLIDNAWVTLAEVLLGLALSVVAGVVLAVVMHLHRPLRDAAYPLLVASQAIPIVVLAPLFVLAFDYGMGPKVAIVALICFFPITVNVLDGLRSAPAELLKLMRSLGASRLQTLRKVELPAALPSFFTGLRVAATVSVIGAVFGEWAGADEGLGRLVLLAQQPAPDAAGLRGHRAADADGGGAVRARHARRPPALPLEPRGSQRVSRLTLLLIAVCALVASGCGEKEDVLRPEGSKRIELMLDYFPNADHAPIYAAEAAGHFDEAGIDVEIRQPPGPAAPLKQLAAGRVDLAISYEPEVLRARDKGLSVVSVGALVQRPLTSIISLPEAKIREPADLKGKTVGTAGIDYQSAYLRTILLEAGGHAVEREGAQRGLLARPGAADRPGGRHPRRVLELRGRGPASGAGASRGSSGWTTPACPPTTSWCWWPTPTRWTATAARSAPSSARSRAACATCARTRTTAHRRPARGQSRPRPGAAARGAEGHPAAVLPAARQALRLAGPGAVGRVRRVDGGQPAARRAAGHAPGVHQRAAARRGALATTLSFSSRSSASELMQ